MFAREKRRNPNKHFLMMQRYSKGPFLHPFTHKICTKTKI